MSVVGRNSFSGAGYPIGANAQPVLPPRLPKDTPSTDLITPISRQSQIGRELDFYSVQSGESLAKLEKRLPTHTSVSKAVAYSVRHEHQAFNRLLRTTSLRDGYVLDIYHAPESQTVQLFVNNKKVDVNDEVHRSHAMPFPKTRADAEGLAATINDQLESGAWVIKKTGEAFTLYPTQVLNDERGGYRIRLEGTPFTEYSTTELYTEVYNSTTNTYDKVPMTGAKLPSTTQGAPLSQIRKGIEAFRIEAGPSNVTVKLPLKGGGPVFSKKKRSGVEPGNIAQQPAQVGAQAVEELPPPQEAQVELEVPPRAPEPALVENLHGSDSENESIASANESVEQVVAPPRYHAQAVKAAEILSSTSASFSDDEAKRSAMRAIQWYKNAELLLSEEAKSASPGDLKKAFKYLMNGLNTLLEDYPEAIEANLVAEILHHNLYIMVNHLLGRPSSAPFQQEDIREWETIVVRMKSSLKYLEGVPTNTLHYELSIIEKGLKCLKTNSIEGLTILGDVGVGAAQLALRSDPRALLIAIGKGINYGAKKYQENQDQNLFETISDIETFKTALMLQLLEPNPSQTTMESIKDNLIQAQTIVMASSQWEVVYTWIKCLTELMSFSTATIQQEDVEQLRISIDDPSLTLEKLERLGWVHQLSDGRCIVAQNLAGTYTSAPDKSQALKKALMKMKKGVSAEMQRFIYFGTEAFHGLDHYAGFGSPSHEGIMGIIKQAGGQVVSGMESGDTLK
ncbi:hypothetical protein HOH87_00150 [bacterium]|jgi:hypothetical protein|nr:hypothetical protein [bacterium]